MKQKNLQSFLPKIPTLALTSLLLGSTMATAQDMKPQGHNMKMDGKKMMKMRKMRNMHHANPMPNLMMIPVKHADKLNLEPEQEIALAAWRKKSNPKAQALVKGIMEKEAALMKAALADTPKATLMKDLDALLKLRRTLADRKNDCRDNLRKILNKEQFAKVLAIYSASVAKHRKKAPTGKKAKMMAMHHANPMPNLMRMIMKHNSSLNINPDQDTALGAWRKGNKAKAHARVQNIHKQEAAMMDAALADKPKADVMKLVDTMLTERRALASGKIDCRDNMAKILNKEQYGTVRKLYAKHSAKPMKKAMAKDGHEIQITQAWARKTLVKGGNSAAFMVLTNTGKKDNELVEAKASISQRVELHTHIKKPGGIMLMRKLDGGIPLKAGQDTVLGMGGLHIMFIKMNRDLNEGDTFKLTLKFKHGKEKTITVPAKMTMKKGSGKHRGSHH